MAVAALVLLTVSVLPAGLGGGMDLPPRTRLLLRDPDVEGEAGTIRRAPADLYGVACEARADEPDDLVSAVAGLADRLGDAVDRSRSVAIAGTDHVVLPGGGPAVLVYALHRRPNLTLSAFHDYWLSVHADFGRRALHGQGYRQLHADPALSAEVAKSAGVVQCDLDGAVVSESASWDEVSERRRLPQMRAAGAAALADENNFIDHTRSVIMRYNAMPAPPGGA